MVFVPEPFVALAKASHELVVLAVQPQLLPASMMSVFVSALAGCKRLPGISV